MERYFECQRCGQVVQGWHTTFEWYRHPCADGPVHEWVEVRRPKGAPPIRKRRVSRSIQRPAGANPAKEEGR